MPRTDPHLWVVVLAGGVGSRFWPVSTPARPKQLLPLASNQPLIRDTVDRALGLVPPERLRVLTGAHLKEPISSALTEAMDELFLVEPRSRGTGPVLTWAAHQLRARDPEAVLVSLHSDHVIEPVSALHQLLRATAELAARKELLFTIGVRPDRPATGYGYIRPGDSIAGGQSAGARRAESFVEKPGEELARRYVEDGYLWNTGIFVWRAETYLREVEDCAPEIAPHLGLLDRGDVEGFFEAVPRVSVDVAVLERSDRVGVVTADFRWDDLGSWDALRRTLHPDAARNVSVGDVHMVESSGNTAVSEEGAVVLFGVDDLVVVRTPSLTFVTHRDRAPELKELLARLPPELRNPEAQ